MTPQALYISTGTFAYIWETVYPQKGDLASKNSENYLFNL